MTAASEIDASRLEEARLYEKAEGGYADCRLCAFYCHIAEGKRGICGVRENRGGALYTLVYHKIIASGSDPVEKKPLFHFQPGSTSYSIATVGCNFRCKHCQNSEISQMPRDHKRIIGDDVTPARIVGRAEAQGCASIAYTYTEPTIFFELARDCGVLAHERGLKNIFVSNGYMSPECIEEAVEFLDAANIDLKAFSDETYNKLCGARLGPVLDTIELMRERGIWVEVTTLIIPTLNDSDEELRKIARWLYSTDKKMPWHISAFYPTYKLDNLPRTPLETLRRAREIGLAEGLRYVYTGNVPGDSGESTYCPECGVTLIDRVGYHIRANRIDDSKCYKCKTPIDGVEL